METQGLALAMAAYPPGGSEELARILKLARKGDLAAFEQLILRHERLVLRTAFRLLGRLEDAQDAAQEVFLRLHKHLHGFDETREFGPWLYRMTVNVCRDLRRRRPLTVPLGEIDVPADSQEELRRGEQRKLIAEGLKRLGEKERAALVLRDLEGLPTDEVARILGTTEATVRSQISMARLKIRNYLRRRA